MTRENDHDLRPSGATVARQKSQQVRVLVADDDDDFRETLCIWLADEDTYDTNDVRNGAEALANLDETVDILVLDRQMPKLSGPDVVERLDTTDFDGAVIVISAETPDSTLCETDVTAYLTKPIDQARFVDTMHQSI